MLFAALHMSACGKHKADIPKRLPVCPVLEVKRTSASDHEDAPSLAH
jgi:hypothetical protein